MKKATLKQVTIEYVVWNDNLSEMKHFCLDQCKITYETCEIDDYWHLQVYDDFREKWVTVPLGHRVVKLGPDDFIVVDPGRFKALFEEEKN